MRTFQAGHGKRRYRVCDSYHIMDQNSSALNWERQNNLLTKTYVLRVWKFNLLRNYLFRVGILGKMQENTCLGYIFTHFHMKFVFMWNLFSISFSHIFTLHTCLGCFLKVVLRGWYPPRNTSPPPRDSHTFSKIMILWKYLFAKI